MTQGGLARSYGLLKDEDEGDEDDDEEMFFCQSDPTAPRPGFVCRFAEEFCRLHQVTARISVKRRRP